MQLQKIFNKKKIQFIDVFSQPKKNSLFQRITEKFLPSVIIIGSGFILGLLTYSGLVLCYYTFSFLKNLISHPIDFKYTLIVDILSLISYIFGTYFFINSVLAFKNYNKNSNEFSLLPILTYAIFAVILLALPSCISVEAEGLGYLKNTKGFYSCFG